VLKSAIQKYSRRAETDRLQSSILELFQEGFYSSCLRRLEIILLEDLWPSSAPFVLAVDKLRNWKKAKRQSGPKPSKKRSLKAIVDTDDEKSAQQQQQDCPYSADEHRDLQIECQTMNLAHLMTSKIQGWRGNCHVSVICLKTAIDEYEALASASSSSTTVTSPAQNFKDFIQSFKLSSLLDTIPTTAIEKLPYVLIRLGTMMEKLLLRIPVRWSEEVHIRNWDTTQSIIQIVLTQAVRPLLIFAKRTCKNSSLYQLIHHLLIQRFVACYSTEREIRLFLYAALHLIVYCRTSIGIAHQNVGIPTDSPLTMQGYKDRLSKFSTEYPGDIHDYVFDKHTHAEGKGMQHFLSVGALLQNPKPELYCPGNIEAANQFLELSDALYLSIEENSACLRTTFREKLQEVRRVRPFTEQSCT
jgi:hypothetical protein